MAALEAVLTLATALKAFEPDEALITQGGSSRSMFALVSGRATASRDDGTATRCDLPDFAPGEVFGEAALAEGAPDFATVVAACPTVALRFSRKAMAAVIAGHPSVIAALREVR